MLGCIEIEDIAISKTIQYHKSCPFDESKTKMVALNIGRSQLFEELDFSKWKSYAQTSLELLGFISKSSEFG